MLYVVNCHAERRYAVFLCYSECHYKFQYGVCRSPLQGASYKNQLFIFWLKLVSTFKPILNTIIKKLIIWCFVGCHFAECCGTIKYQTLLFRKPSAHIYLAPFHSLYQRSSWVFTSSWHCPWVVIHLKIPIWNTLEWFFCSRDLKLITLSS